MEYQLGVVFSGGGARAIAQVGVLHALTERGLEVECLGGTSAGALVAALYAAGHSTEAVLDFFETRSPFKLSKLSFGKPGLIDTAKIRDDLLEYFPDTTIESLDRRLFITATDLLNAKLTIFGSGSLIDALLATSSVPLVFTPTEIDGRWYVDGGIIDNFPVAPLIGLCDVIVGVYVSPLKALDMSQLSNSLAVSQRALEIARFHNSRHKFHDCDVMLCPKDLNGYLAFDTRYVRDIFDIGYREAVSQLDAIEAALASIIR